MRKTCRTFGLKKQQYKSIKFGRTHKISVTDLALNRNCIKINHTKRNFKVM